MLTQTVCVVGLGYIGLPTATFLASAGHFVVGVDINQATVDLVNDGRCPFSEPGFEPFMRELVEAGQLQASTKIVRADAFVVAVPTPFNTGHQVDLSYVDAAIRSITPVLEPGNLIVLESTTSPGTTDEIQSLVERLRPELKGTILFAHAPERVLPGNIMAEMVSNDRIIGGVTPAAGAAASQLYKTFCSGTVHVTDARTAELTKLAENSFRDVNIAFANELAEICSSLGIDVWEMIYLANRHPRVNILSPGPGVGGHCIAVDPWFIVSAAPETAALIRTARRVNDSRPDYFVNEVIAAKADLPDDAAIAVLGLTFKANVEDLRQSPSVEIVRKLLGQLPNTDFYLVDPLVPELPSELKDHPNASLVSLEEGLKKAGIVLLLVDHDQFLNIPPSQLGSATIIDAKGVLREIKERV